MIELLRSVLAANLVGVVGSVITAIDCWLKSGGLVLPSNAMGASGAVTATILLDIFLRLTATLYFIIPGMFLLGQDFLRVNSGNSTISGSAHLGGATVAAIVWARLQKGRRLV